MRTTLGSRSDDWRQQAAPDMDLTVSRVSPMTRQNSLVNTLRLLTVVYRSQLHVIACRSESRLPDSGVQCMSVGVATRPTLTSKIVVVTGVSAGIGDAIARRLLAGGCAVYARARRIRLTTSATRRAAPVTDRERVGFDIRNIRFC